MTETRREMAERTTILRAPVGSTIHGLHLEGKDDRDEMGICLEDIEGVVGFSEFEQFIYRTASEREGKHNAPSQPGDLDLTIYGLKKYLRLALQGNPTILTLLFVPGKLCLVRDAIGGHLQDLAPSIISRQAGRRYLGYLEQQRQRLLGERGGRDVNRKDLEERFGFDTKYAMHMLRLGVQGIELLETGRVTFPMPEPNRSFIRSVREGKVGLDAVLTETGHLERRIKDLIDSSPLPEEPDREKVEAWMIERYFQAWRARTVTTMYFDAPHLNTPVLDAEIKTSFHQGKE